MGDALEWARERVASWVTKADLDQRDPDYIRDQLPGTCLLASFYFRADARGLDQIPADGPVRLARETRVPIAPVASVGGQESALFLNRGQWLAKLLMADKLLRLKSIPMSLALPWGLNISDPAGHIPLPTKVVIEVQEPIDADGDDQAVHDKVLASLQSGVDRLAAERRFPVIG